MGLLERIAGYDNCEQYPGRPFILLRRGTKSRPIRSFKDKTTGNYAGWTPGEARAHLIAGGGVALHPGRIGFLVVDVDEGPETSIIALARPVFATHDRRHLWYSKPTDGREYGNRDGVTLPGPSKCDIRCERGLVVLHDPAEDLDMIATALDALSDGTIERAEPPDCVLSLFEKRSYDASVSDPHDDWGEYGRAALIAAMDAIDMRRIMETSPDGFPYSDWLPFSQALFHVSGGCGIVRDRWMEWSRDRWGSHVIREKQHSEENLSRKWAGFEVAGNQRKLGYGTIYRIAEKYAPGFDPDANINRNDNIDEYMKLFE